MWGDRAQQFVFIGIGLDESVICERLEAALVTDEEVEAGVARWRTLTDLLPVWE